MVGSVQLIEPHSDQARSSTRASEWCNSITGGLLLYLNSLAELCRSRAMILIALDDSTVVLVECSVQLDKLWPSNGMPDSIVVQTVPVYNHIHQLAVLNTALIRDSLMAGGAERLAEESGAMACGSNGG